MSPSPGPIIHVEVPASAFLIIDVDLVIAAVLGTVAVALAVWWAVRKWRTSR